MDALNYPFVAIACEAEFGAELYFSLANYLEVFNLDGSKKEAYADATFVCRDCSVWLKHMEASMRKLSLPLEEGTGAP
jgi:hypothetical protein